MPFGMVLRTTPAIFGCFVRSSAAPEPDRAVALSPGRPATVKHPEASAFPMSFAHLSRSLGKTTIGRGRSSTYVLSAGIA